MITFFKKGAKTVFAVESDHKLSQAEIEKFYWLFDGAKALSGSTVKGIFIGPRREMITPWSTNAVEIAQNMGISGITRIEEFTYFGEENPEHDKMLQRVYKGLNKDIFTITKTPEQIIYIENLMSTMLRIYL